MSYLEICVHSYKYSKLLNLQLSSYYLHGGEYLKDIKHVVYTCKEDESTNAVCDFFSDKINLEKRILPLKTLAARGYGRNMAVEACESEWIWFADADHLISDGSLAHLFDILSTTKYKFLYPCRAVKNKMPSDIDNYLKKIDVPEIIDFDFKTEGIETAVKKHNVASGGVQIFKSNCIKQCGYAYRHTGHDDWVSCRDDKRARKRFMNFFPDSKTQIVLWGHRHLTHGVKRRNDHNAEL